MEGERRGGRGREGGRAKFKDDGSASTGVDSDIHSNLCCSDM